MDPIYVFGHRTPDTDSVVSAMAYAALHNSLGDREYVPARLGQLNDETAFLLDKFGFKPPMLLQTVRTQVRDLDFDRPPLLGAAVATPGKSCARTRAFPPCPSPMKAACSTA